jgi:hypothetical protein
MEGRLNKYIVSMSSTYNIETKGQICVATSKNRNENILKQQQQKSAATNF